jgi:hypothetical protein
MTSEQLIKILEEYPEHEVLVDIVKIGKDGTEYRVPYDLHPQGTITSARNDAGFVRGVIFLKPDFNRQAQITSHTLSDRMAKKLAKLCATH